MGTMTIAAQLVKLSRDKFLWIMSKWEHNKNIVPERTKEKGR
jgi:hypothetical protein